MLATICGGGTKSLEALKFKGGWIFVPTDKEDRGFYDKYGVSRYSCFQRVEKVQSGTRKGGS